MAIQLTTTSQAAALHGVKVLVYGPPGMGKTMLTATAPNPILISAESGLLSLARKNIEKVFGVDNPAIAYDIPVIEVKTVEDLIQAYDWIQSPEGQQFQTICIDSLSEIAEVVLANAKKQVKDPRQAYGELIEKMMDTVRKFRDLSGRNVYMSAKMEMTKDELTGMNMYMPSMPGSKLGQQLPYLFDEVFTLRTSKDKEGNEFRYLQTQPDLQFVAKDRSGQLDAMEGPWLYNVFAKIAS